MTDLIWYTCVEEDCGLRFSVNKLNTRCYEYPQGQYNHVRILCASKYCCGSVIWFYDGMTRFIAAAFWRTVPIVSLETPDDVVVTQLRSHRQAASSETRLAARDEAMIAGWRASLAEMSAVQIMTSLRAPLSPVAWATTNPVPRPRLPKISCIGCRRSCTLESAWDVQLVFYGQGVSCNGFTWTCARCLDVNREFNRSTPWCLVPGLRRILRDDYGAYEYHESVPDPAVRELFTRRFRFFPPDIT